MATSISLGTLTLELEALTKSFQKDMKGVSDSVNGAVDAIKGIGVVAGVGAAALGALGAKAVSTAAGFESAMTKAAIVTSNLGEAGAENFGKLRQAALDAASATEFSASQAASGIELMGQAGFETSEILSGLPKVLQLASAASVTVAQATDAAANTISAFGLDVEKDLSRVNDVFVTTTNSANTNFSMLAAALEPVAPIARNMGMSLEQTSAIIGKLADNGVKGSKAGVALRAVLSSLLNPSREAAGVMKDLGVNIKNNDGTLKDFSSILREMGPIASDTGALMKIFGREAGPSMAILLNEGAYAVDNLTAKIQGNLGAAAQAAEANMATFEGKVAALNSKLENAGIIIGDMVKDALLPLVDIVDQAVQAFIDLPDWVQETIVVLAGLAAAGLAAVAALVGIVAGIAGLISAVSAIAAAKATLLAIGAAVAAIGATAAAVGAGIAGLISILNQLHNVYLFYERDIAKGRLLKSLAMDAKLMFRMVTNPIVEMFDAVSSYAQQTIGDLVGWISSQIPQGIKDAFSSFPNFVDALAGSIREYIPDAWKQSFETGVSFVKGTIPKMIAEIGKLANAITSKIGKAFTDVFGPVLEFFKGLPKLIKDSLPDFMKPKDYTPSAPMAEGAGVFGKLGGDFVKSLGFKDVEDASGKLSGVLGKLAEAAKKAAENVTPRATKTAAQIQQAREAAAKQEQAARKQEAENAYYDRLNAENESADISAKQSEDRRIARERERAAKEAENVAKEESNRQKELDEMLEANRKDLAAGIEREKDRQKTFAEKRAYASRGLTEIFTDSMAELGAYIADNLEGLMGEFGKVVSDVVEGAKTGGVWGAVVAAILSLAKRTKGFEEMTARFDESLKQATDAISPLTAALVPFAQMLNFTLIPAFEVLKGVMMVVAGVLLGIASFILTVVKRIGQAWNAIIDKISDWLGGKDLDKLKLNLNGVNRALEEVEEIFKTLGDTTSDVTDGQEDQADSLDALNSSLLNAPQGFKVALERFNATVRDGSNVANVGMVAGSPFGGEMVMGNTVNIGTINLQSDDPAAVMEEIQREADKSRLRRTGTTRPTGGEWQSSAFKRFGA